MCNVYNERKLQECTHHRERKGGRGQKGERGGKRGGGDGGRELCLNLHVVHDSKVYGSYNTTKT